MAAFVQSFSIAQSSDCKTLTFTDTSNFSSNTEGYTYSYFTTKNIGVYDSNNTLIGSLIPIVDATPVTFTLDKDRYLHIVYTLQHNTDTPLTSIQNVALSCNVELAYGNIVANEESNCSCNNEQLFNINKTLTAAKIFASRNNPILAQDQLDLANMYAGCLGNTSVNSGCGC